MSQTQTRNQRARAKTVVVDDLPHFSQVNNICGHPQIIDDDGHESGSVVAPMAGIAAGHASLCYIGPCWEGARGATESAKTGSA
jgi:hypothetical protein